MTTKFIILEEYNGYSREASSEEEAGECVKELMDDLGYGGTGIEDAESYIRIYEVRKEWDFDTTIRVFEPKPKPKKTTASKKRKKDGCFCENQDRGGK